MGQSQQIEHHRHRGGSTMSELIESAARTVQEKQERIEAATMVTKSGHFRSLHERMMDFTIPGVSIAVINNYHLEWACGYGVRKQGESAPVEPTTLFQACSISKAVTAIA